MPNHRKRRPNCSTTPPHRARPPAPIAPLSPPVQGDSLRPQRTSRPPYNAHTHTTLLYTQPQPKTSRYYGLQGPYWTAQDVQYQHPICLNSRTPCSMWGGFIYHFSNKMPIIHPHVHLRCAVSSSNITNVTPACDNHSEAECAPDLTVTT